MPTIDNDSMRYIQRRENDLDAAFQPHQERFAKLCRWLLPHSGAALGSKLSSVQNQAPGSNPKLIDRYGTVCLNRASAGTLAGLCSPEQEWFYCQTGGPNGDNQTAREFNDAFRSAISCGIGAIWIDRDHETVINVRDLDIGTYRVGYDHRRRVNMCLVKSALSHEQLAEKFGEDALTPQIRDAMKRNDYATLVDIHQIVMPNNGKVSAPNVPSGRFPWISITYIAGKTLLENGQCHILEARGYTSFPLIAARWDVIGDSAYPVGPGDDAVETVMSLQDACRKKGENTALIVKPPLIGSGSVNPRTLQLFPNGITIVPEVLGGIQENLLRPVFAQTPIIDPLLNDIAKYYRDLDRFFFTDLFLLITNEREQGIKTEKTAVEIIQQQREKMLILGPIMVRWTTEFLDAALERIFDIILDSHIIEVPEDLHGATIKIKYRSPLLQAQKLIGTSGIEPWMRTIGNLGAIDISVFDRIDMDDLVDVSAEAWNVPAKVIRSIEDANKIRDARAQKNAENEQLAQAGALAEGAKTLSQADLGGGTNALTALLNNGMPAR